MIDEKKEIKSKVQQFYIMLNNYTDHPDSTAIFLGFIRNFLRIKTKMPLPTIELMTLLKKHKPSVFMTLRKMAKTNILLSFLTDLSMEIEEAEQRLKEIMENESFEL